MVLDGIIWMGLHGLNGFGMVLDGFEDGFGGRLLWDVLACDYPHSCFHACWRLETSSADLFVKITNIEKTMEISSNFYDRV